MHIVGKIAATAALLCMVFLVANPAGAFPAGDRNITCPVAGSQGDRMSGLLDMLSEKGYDVSAIQSAITDGNMSAARALLDQLKDAANLTRPEPPAGGMTRGNGTHMEGLLGKLEENGYDVSAIRSAIESGDKDAARDLLDQLKASANITMPERPRDGMAGNMTRDGMAFNETRMQGLIDLLESKGIDVSGIESALGSGDASAARDLLDQLKESANLTLPGGAHRGGGPACNATTGFSGRGSGSDQVSSGNGLSTTARTQVQQYAGEDQVQMPSVPGAGMAGGGRNNRIPFV